MAMSWVAMFLKDQNSLNNSSFPLPAKVSEEEWLNLGQWFQRRCCLRMMDA